MLAKRNKEAKCSRRNQQWVVYFLQRKEIWRCKQNSHQCVKCGTFAKEEKQLSWRCSTDPRKGSEFNGLHELYEASVLLGKSQTETKGMWAASLTRPGCASHTMCSQDHFVTNICPACTMTPLCMGRVLFVAQGAHLLDVCMSSSRFSEPSGSPAAQCKFLIDVSFYGCKSSNNKLRQPVFMGAAVWTAPTVEVLWTWG